MYEYNGFARICDERCWICNKKEVCENYNKELNESNFKPTPSPKYNNIWEALKQARNESSNTKKTTENELSIREFVNEKVNNIINKYYKSCYDARRMIKYLKIVYDGGLRFGWTCQGLDNDMFYISGNMAKDNIMENLKKLTPAKEKAIKQYIKDIDIYELDKYLNIYDYCDETRNRFTNYVVAKINPVVHKSPSTGNYYVNKYDLNLDKLIHKNEIIEKFNKHIKQINNEI